MWLCLCCLHIMVVCCLLAGSPPTPSAMSDHSSLLQPPLQPVVVPRATSYSPHHYPQADQSNVPIKHLCCWVTGLTFYQMQNHVNLNSLHQWALLANLIAIFDELSQKTILSTVFILVSCFSHPFNNKQTKMKASNCHVCTRYGGSVHKTNLYRCWDCCYSLTCSTTWAWPILNIVTTSCIYSLERPDFSHFTGWLAGHAQVQFAQMGSSESNPTGLVSKFLCVAAQEPGNKASHACTKTHLHHSKWSHSSSSFGIAFLHGTVLFCTKPTKYRFSFFFLFCFVFS